jgi:1,5-anhydro-D-fructose reductase (1,5-anhydro-D-mannitol-forming)
MGKKIKWGIMGAGLIADDRIAPALSKTNNSELVAIYTRSKDKAKTFALKYNVLNYYDNKMDFLANKDIDVVYISTPNACHYEDIISTLKADKHVFCEKPIATSVDEALKIQEVCSLSKKKFGLAFMFPFHPLSILAKNWIDQGRIGKILLLKSNFIFDLPECEKINPWRFDPNLSGGGAIIEVGCHCIDIFNFLLGNKVVSVNAVTNISKPSESLAILTTTYENGTLGLITVSNNIPGAGPFGTNFEVHGENGSIIGLGNLSRNPSGKLIYRDKLGKEEIISLPNVIDYQLYIDEIESFSNHIINGTDLYGNLENGIQNMKVIDAAYMSSSEKKTITI